MATDAVAREGTDNTRFHVSRTPTNAALMCLCDSRHGLERSGLREHSGFADDSPAGGARIVIAPINDNLPER
jgi:hypothetical protein